MDLGDCTGFIERLCALQDCPIPDTEEELQDLLCLLPEDAGNLVWEVLQHDDDSESFGNDGEELEVDLPMDKYSRFLTWFEQDYLLTHVP